MVTAAVAAVVVVLLLLRVKRRLSGVGWLLLMLLLMLDRWFAFLALVRDEAAPFEEDDDACDVVDRIFFTLPGRHRLLDYDAARALQIIPMPEGHDQVNHLVVGKELPDAVGGQNHELIIVVNEKLLNLCTNTKNIIK